MIIRDSSVTTPSSYRGGVYEQVVGMNTITGMYHRRCSIGGIRSTHDLR
jgi:hypothetical protein